jgi:hypothetical protein
MTTTQTTESPACAADCGQPANVMGYCAECWAAEIARRMAKLRAAHPETFAPRSKGLRIKGWQM